MGDPAVLSEQTGTATERPPFKVKDLSLASWGRNEIRLAEQEMPGLMAIHRADAWAARRGGCRGGVPFGFEAPLSASTGRLGRHLW